MLLDHYATPNTLPNSESLRVAGLLSLKAGSDFTEIGLARLIEAGLPARSATALSELLGNMVIPEATLRRAKNNKKPLSKEHSEKLYELSRVLDVVGRIYQGNRSKVENFLNKPHPLLEGDTPLAMASSSSAGANAVLNMLARAEAGVAL